MTTDNYPGTTGESSSCPSPGCAEAAAKTAVKEVFAIIGVDVDVPKEVEAFRDILRFIRSVKRMADRSGLAMVGTMVAITITYLVSKVWGYHP